MARGRKPKDPAQKRGARLVAYCKAETKTRLYAAAESRNEEIGEYLEALAQLDLGLLAVPDK